MQGRMIFFFSKIINFFIIIRCMLPKLNGMYNFQTFIQKENYFFVVTCRVTPAQTPFRLQEVKSVRLVQDFYKDLTLFFFLASFLRGQQSSLNQCSLFGCSKFDWMGSRNYWTAPLFGIQHFFSLVFYIQNYVGPIVLFHKKKDNT